jgi:hypothetical protein
VAKGPGAREADIIKFRDLFTITNDYISLSTSVSAKMK